MTARPGSSYATPAVTRSIPGYTGESRMAPPFVPGRPRAAAEPAPPDGPPHEAWNDTPVMTAAEPPVAPPEVPPPAADDMVLDDVVTVDAAPEWPDTQPAGTAEPMGDTHEGPESPEGAFPIEAFFVPSESSTSPSGYAADAAAGTDRKDTAQAASGDDASPADAMAEQLGSRLEQLGRLVRERGVTALGGAHSPDELTRLLAAVVAGYLARDR